MATYNPIGSELVAADDFGTVLALTTAGTTAQTNIFTNPMPNLGHRGIVIPVYISAISGTGATLTITLLGYDSGSQQYWSIGAYTGITTTGVSGFDCYPGIPNTSPHINDILPAWWNVAYAITGTSPSITAKVGVHLIS